MTTEFVPGPLLKANWIWSGGTIALDPDYRTCTFTPSVDIVDGTAGADTSKVKYMGMRDFNVSMTLVTQTGGTLLNAALDAGVGGTLIIQPEGTATGKPKFTCPAFSTGASFEFPYNDVAQISVTFEGQGAYTIGANS